MPGPDAAAATLPVGQARIKLLYEEYVHYSWLKAVRCRGTGPSQLNAAYTESLPMANVCVATTGVTPAFVTIQLTASCPGVQLQHPHDQWQANATQHVRPWLSCIGLAGSACVWLSCMGPAGVGRTNE